MIRVLVADDQALVRGGFRVLVDSAPDLEVVGEAGDGTEAVALARKERPDVILMDIRMPHLDGLEATRGWSNAEIAERLYLSPATAKTHVGRLLTKLLARDRTQLVVIAYETGLVTPSGPAGLE